MESWSFLTKHAQVLLRVAQDPGARLRDIAASLGITERSAYSIVADLTHAGYVVKYKDGRRNRYQIQAHLPLPDLVRTAWPRAARVLDDLRQGSRRSAAWSTVVCRSRPSGLAGGWDLGPAGRSHASAGPLS